mmetsp:Transcript_31023/g.56381  ORF Transcript_31023/g.56381 Transcript_31023/m.56381 type:complete len:245 (-) Transcript_31023:137-871(-)
MLVNTDKLPLLLQAHDQAVLIGAGVAHSESEPQQCQVLGDFVGYLMQFVLFCACVSSLLLKWRLERPPRRLVVFLLDSSKQIIGSGWLHALNMITAIYSVGTTNGDECAWYWVNLMSDCTIGLLVVYSMLRLSESLFEYESGLYYADAADGSDGDIASLDYLRWAKQMAGYLAIVTVKKISVILLLWLCLPYSLRLGIWATQWISNMTARLAFVMVITPIVMDTFSLWVTDSFIKFGKEKSSLA